MYEATKLIASVAPFVKIISSLYFALIYDFTISLVSSNLLVALLLMYEHFFQRLKIQFHKILISHQLRFWFL